MVTLTKIGNEYNSQVLEIVGLSTDEKPTTSIDNIAISNGSVFKEIDTGAEYLYNTKSNEWVKNMSSTTSASGKDGITPLLQKSSNAIQVSYDEGSTYSDLVALSEITGAKGDKGDKGDNGAAGKDGAAGAKGDKGASIASITLFKDEEGNINGGTATLTDDSTVEIVVTSQTV